MPLKYLLILFVCYLPLYLALLIYLRTKIEGYSMRDHMVSFLATSSEPWRSIFNAATVLYGALSFAVPFSLKTLVEANSWVGLGAASLLSAGAATVLVGFFPMDKRLKVHNAVGFMAFFSALFAGLVFFVLFSQGKLFSPLMELVNFAVLATTILLGLSLLFHRKESSLLEWIAFLCTLAWNFLLAALLLIRAF
ncbi:MAG: DUF998 domain-containing protein [Bacteroidota bacterium]